MQPRRSVAAALALACGAVGAGSIVAGVAPVPAGAHSTSPAICDRELGGVVEVVDGPRAGQILYTAGGQLWAATSIVRESYLDGPDFRALTLHPSPDRSHIVVVETSDPFDEKWITVLDTELSVVRSVFTGEQEVHPVWAPDGDRFLAFMTTTDGSGLAIVDVGSDAVEFLPAPFAEAPAWSPDGSRLAWITSETAVVAESDGSAPVVVSELGDPIRGVRSLAFSPDGSTLAFSGRDGTGSAGVFVSSVDGTGRARLPVDPSGVPPALRWSPDGDRVAFVDSAFAPARLMVAELAGDTWTVAAAPEPPAWSPSGDRIAWVDPDGAVVVSSLAGERIGEQSRIGTLPDDAGGLRWTDTGGELLWVGRLGSTSHAFAAQPDGSGLRFVSSGAGPRVFDDVDPESFARFDIRCIAGLGITTGTGPGRFAPEDGVTREQMAAFAARLLRVTGRACPVTETPFVDVSTRSFAADDIACLFGLGITTGTSPTTYAPDEPLTREQLAAFVFRLWRLVGGTCPTFESSFVDVPPSSFARDAVGCLGAQGIIRGTSPTTYEPTEPVTRAQTASLLARLLRRMPAV